MDTKFLLTLSMPPNTCSSCKTRFLHICCEKDSLHARSKSLVMLELTRRRGCDGGVDSALRAHLSAHAREHA